MGIPRFHKSIDGVKSEQGSWCLHADVVILCDRLIKKWLDRIDDMERSSDGVSWQGEIREIRQCVDELRATYKA